MMPAETITLNDISSVKGVGKSEIKKKILKDGLYEHGNTWKQSIDMASPSC